VYVKTCFVKVQFGDTNIIGHLIKHTSWRHMGSGGTALHVLHFDIEWRWLVNFITRTFYLQRISSWYPLNWLGGPLSQSGYFGMESEFIRQPAQSFVTQVTEVSWTFQEW
jgi:hypothetical protein